MFQLGQRHDERRDEVLHIRPENISSLGVFHQLSEHIKVQRHREWKTLHKLQQHGRNHGDSFIHVSAAVASVTESEGEVPRHPEERLDDRLDPLLRIVTQLHDDLPKIVKEELQLGPRFPRYQNIGCGYGRLPCRCSTRAQRRDEVLRNEWPFIRIFREKRLRCLASKVICHQSDDCLTGGCVRVVELWEKLRPHRHRTQLALQHLRKARGLQVHSLQEHIRSPHRSNRLIQQRNEERRVLEFAGKEDEVLQGIDAFLRCQLQGVVAHQTT
mmetsp:Transcript_57264/g.152721  ORF Transcript_57264/g.152721 Transcript_57264/m.152721 type:complete len:271 (-) Transcript_57264:549-1361(-)